MTTPAELDAKAARLREIASDLRKEATAVTGLLSGVKDLHDDQTWQGPVATEFSGTLTGWKSRIDGAQQAILDAAATFDKDANNLETQAGDQRREEKDKEEKEKGPK
ncbi:type VII secretion system (Wss) protein ESAT-6 [Kribbella steppae]|uniref:Type VII secretion system (Wss) protein ESAT-6 n=1 Tax=Kribbella steppae TaxID=2512223 RepID=A0A4R2HUD2_9ACTN|nr:WXG100 family type VII secretion target [Kribbella steppae]TCO33625.1 type VII secretion system (Wss) protein ESAT-6 [Kribbella steppae]